MKHLSAARPAVWLLAGLLVPGAAVSTARAGAFEARGSVTQHFGGTAHRFDFRVTRLPAGTYQIRTEDHFDPPTRRVVGHDGLDHYQIDTALDEDGQAIEFGHVHAGGSPTNLHGLGDLLRLGFLIRQDPAGVAGLTNLGFFDGNRPLLGVSRAEVLEEGPPGAESFRAVRFMGRRDPTGPERAIGEFRVEAFTNHQGSLLPLVFTLESRLPEDVTGGAPRPLERLTARVEEIGRPSVTDPLPRPSGERVHVTDTRFVDAVGKPLLYTLTNGAWTGREAPWLRERVRDLRLRKLASEGRLKARRLPAYLVLVVLVTFPVALHLLRSRRPVGVPGS